MHMAVGTSVFIMAFTALTGGISHFAIGGHAGCHMPHSLRRFHAPLGEDCPPPIANRASAVTLNRVVGIVMILTSIVILLVNYVF